MNDHDRPAILGGAPLRPQGPPAWPLADVEVASALQRAVADGSWGRYNGPHGETLQEALRATWGCEHVILCGSGTYAVELGLRALRVEAGDEVVLASYDFPGNFLAVHALGATPVLVDIEPGNWNLSLTALMHALSPRTKAILVSHLHGGVVPMWGLVELAKARGILVLEDACQCPGARIEGRRAGTWGDIGVVSFGGSKLLTAGRGGALLTAQADLAQRARTFSLRGNVVCPLSEMQAAALVPQVARLDERNAHRRMRFTQLEAELAGIPGLAPNHNDGIDAEPGYYKVGMQYNATDFGLSRSLFVAALRAEGIAMDEGFAALHVGRSPKRYRAGSSLLESERAHRESVILHHPVLLGEPSDIAQIGTAVRRIHHWADRIRVER